MARSVHARPLGLADASTLQSALPLDVAGPAGLTNEQAETVVEYLKDDGLLKTETFAGDVSITHRGIKEVEASLAAPERPTEHFLLLRRFTLLATSTACKQAP